MSYGWNFNVIYDIDSGDVAALVLLDLSVAFNTVNYDILLRQLHLSFGLDGPALSSFHAYLHGRSQYIRCGMQKSSVMHLPCGVPPGSVLAQSCL